MLVPLGQRVQELHVVDLLTECHARIRRFLDLAHRLATSTTAKPSDIRDTAARIHRYFTTGFPLHLADEEDTILPRLRAREPGLEAAIARIHADHTDHAYLVAALATLCEYIARDPRRLASSATALAEVTDRLTLELEAHLTFEELLVFPALGRLPLDERAAIRAEMRARRDVALEPN